MSQLLSASDTYVPKAGEHGQTPVRRVHERHSTGSSRTGTRPNKLRIGSAELKAVPHAGLGFHFLRVPVGSHRILGVFKRKGGPKGKDRTTNEQADDVRSHLQMH